MESNQPSGRENYRAIVLGHEGDELLLALAANGFLLPSVQIPRGERMAENLMAAVRNEWGQEAICLFNPDEPGLPDSRNSYQVMECCRPAVSQPFAEWTQRSSLSARSFADPRDWQAVQRSLAECDRYAPGVVSAPFARLGWFRELQGWIDDVVRPLGFRLTGRFSQLNASPSFSLIRFETDRVAVWFKAVGKPNLREFPITVALERFLPQYLPPILATRPAWNGWLALEVKGDHPGETQDAQSWMAAAASLARLQIASVDGFDLWLESGARDLRTSTLSGLVRPFLEAMSQLMDRQEKVPPPVLSKNELTLLGEQIEEALSLCRDLDIPDALGHLDLNSGNIIVSASQCVFLDWAEAYVGNPLFSIQYLVENFRRVAGRDATAEASLASAYTGEWPSSISPENLKEAMAFAPMLAVFAYATASEAWRDEARLRDSKLVGYLRSLTRRMHREADCLRNRSALCPN